MLGRLATRVDLSFFETQTVLSEMPMEVGEGAGTRRVSRAGHDWRRCYQIGIDYSAPGGRFTATTLYSGSFLFLTFMRDYEGERLLSKHRSA